MTRALRRLVLDERGYSLPEVLVAATILPLVILAILALSDTANKLAPKDQERAYVIREAQVGLHRMTRELRQAYTVHTNTATSMDVDVLVNGTVTRVVYDCSPVHPADSALRRCTRTVGSASTVVVDRVKPGTVFTYDGQTPPRYVQARVAVPAKGERVDGHKHTVVLDDGFYLRNLPDAS